jgi:hypothetical protein
MGLGCKQVVSLLCHRQQARDDHCFVVGWYWRQCGCRPTSANGEVVADSLCGTQMLGRLIDW